MNNREKPHTSETEELRQVGPAEVLRAAKEELILEALSSRAGIEGLESWRGVDDEGKEAKGMRRFLDSISAFDVAVREASQDREAMAVELKKMAETAGEKTPRARGRIQKTFSCKKAGRRYAGSWIGCAKDI